MIGYRLIEFISKFKILCFLILNAKKNYFEVKIVYAHFTPWYKQLLNLNIQFR